MNTSGRLFSTFLFSPIGIVYLLFLLAPIGFFLSMSLFRYDAFELYVPALTTENFERVLTDGYYQEIIFRTLKIAFLTSLFSLLLGYPLAYFLARSRTQWRGILMFLVIAPLMSGIIVRTYGWIVLLGSDGAVNKTLISIGLIDQPVQILNTETAVLLALVHILMPYMVFPLFSSLASQDPDVERAAGTLGAGRIRTFLEVTLPLSRTGILMGSALVFTLSAGSVVTPALLGGKDVQMLGQQIYDLVLTTLNWPLASAVAFVLVLCQFSIIALYFRGGRHGPA
ncbi:ABC transporter permease protein [Pseudooceanicola batsensis HTCC2597]|uniref:ABC transporter permease protein n=1 Tax=Pseudooceanicola batsensis (strain ATCC BAA-863 / DSM 15984 / KCTC 12145 / HTCC2597) TaxID=252305 RepID=A3U1H5_PSEBH|nr:ABC transporter permease [Pseudooceanicola batsensis]EAQ02158.1 ABC transporter permease protein [Pseudooceanicola batsensis HTCC2597]